MIRAILFSLLLAVSPMTFPWEKLTQDVHAIYGTRIDHDVKDPHPFAEIVYDKITDSFGISFITTDGKRKAIDYAVFNMRTCEINTIGAIAGTSLIDISSKDQLDRMFLDCSRPILFRVWDTSNNQVTYRFENAGPIK